MWRGVLSRPSVDRHHRAHGVDRRRALAPADAGGAFLQAGEKVKRGLFRLTDDAYQAFFRVLPRCLGEGAAPSQVDDGRALGVVRRVRPVGHENSAQLDARAFVGRPASRARVSDRHPAGRDVAGRGRPRGLDGGPGSRREGVHQVWDHRAHAGGHEGLHRPQHRAHAHHHGHRARRVRSSLRLQHEVAEVGRRYGRALRISRGGRRTHGSAGD